MPLLIERAVFFVQEKGGPADGRSREEQMKMPDNIKKQIAKT